MLKRTTLLSLPFCEEVLFHMRLESDHGKILVVFCVIGPLKLKQSSLFSYDMARVRIPGKQNRWVIITNYITRKNVYTFWPICNCNLRNTKLIILPKFCKVSPNAHHKIAHSLVIKWSQMISVVQVGFAKYKLKLAFVICTW